MLSCDMLRCHGDSQRDSEIRQTLFRFCILKATQNATAAVEYLHQVHKTLGRSWVLGNGNCRVQPSALRADRMTSSFEHQCLLLAVLMIFLLDSLVVTKIEYYRSLSSVIVKVYMQSIPS